MHKRTASTNNRTKNRSLSLITLITQTTLRQNGRKALFNRQENKIKMFTTLKE